MSIFKKIFGIKEEDHQSIDASYEKISPKSCQGKYYVNCQCLENGICYETAPELFKKDEEEGVSYVAKQPVSEDELKLMAKCIEGCPVNAIKDDGEVIDWHEFKKKKEI